MWFKIGKLIGSIEWRSDKRIIEYWREGEIDKKEIVGESKENAVWRMKH